MAKIITDKEIEDIIKKSKGAIDNKKKNSPEEYEAIRLGSICKKLNITEEHLEKYNINFSSRTRDLISIIENIEDPILEEKVLKIIQILSEK